MGLMNKSIRKMNLSNGKKIFYLNRAEVNFLDNQIKNYFKHGIKLKKNNTVFDVGANIGMFSLYCCDLCDNKVNIHAFEPIPQIFEVLQRNIQHFNLDEIKLYNYGISNRAKDAVFFDYFPYASGFSTMYSEEPKKFRNAVKSDILQNINELACFVDEINLIRKLPSFLQSCTLDFELARKLKLEKVNCQVKTISQVIYEQNIQQIDLLKIDVEKSELDVLLGINKQDWIKIKQIVIEVHDIKHRVDEIKDLLLSHNFSKVVDEQEPFLDNSEYYNIYAIQNQ
ncbi:MAG TPA: FkbM family methyltransferase [Coleofasciculaceae cyanobacterium]|jgi:FkbM family methyltransferase